MKLLALIALFGGVSAIRLESHSAIKAHSHAEVKSMAHTWASLHRNDNSNVQLRKNAKKFVQANLKSLLPEKLTPEQELEIMEWVIDELGGGTITKQEAHDALVGFLDKHGYPQPTPEEWEMLEAMFDYVDVNGDGEIDLKEFAMAATGPCPEQMVQLKKNAKKFV